jgi:broad specificity phosphatase PhoE
LKETRVVLLRHAETSDPDRFHGAESDIGLGERGMRQAEAVAKVIADLSPDFLVSSGMRRARQTADRIAARCGLIVRIEPELHERKIGPLSGVSREEGLAAYQEAKSRWISGELEFTHEGGESYAQIRARAVPVLERLVNESPERVLAIVSHGVVIRVLLTTLLHGSSHAHFERFAIDNAALNDLRWDGRRWTAAALNQQVLAEGDRFDW